MSWLRRIRSDPPPAQESSVEAEVPRPVEGAAPGIAALLDGVSEDGSHAVLDLGPAVDSNLRLYSRFARRMRFADLMASAGTLDWGDALSAVPPQPERPYDLVFAWDILERVPPEGRERLVKRLAELTAPDARLHVVVEASERTMIHPVRFTLLGGGRVRYEPTGRARPAWPRILPADLERLLEPFHVVHAFTLKVGLREYVAVRKG